MRQPQLRAPELFAALIAHPQPVRLLRGSAGIGDHFLDPVAVQVSAGQLGRAAVQADDPAVGMRPAVGKSPAAIAHHEVKAAVLLLQ